VCHKIAQDGVSSSRDSGLGVQRLLAVGNEGDDSQLYPKILAHSKDINTSQQET
jgi:hypothetical protein